MFIKRLITTTLCAAALCVYAQDSLLLRDLETVRQQNAWLTQSNAAALTQFAAPNIAKAEAALTYERGGLTDYTGGMRQLTADVWAEAFYRLSRRTVVYGTISYQNLSARDATGSAFINPSRMPFDLVEDSLTNAGDKHLDTYRLSGGVGVDVWKGMSVGARLDYTSANYAKYKDLRHKNKLMDLRLTAGVYAPVLSWLSVGADYQYHRQTESVSFSTYGKSEKVYKTFIDYGAFMGRVEQFGNEGFTDKSREMPLFEESHGGAVQLEVRPVERLSLLATARFSHGTGYYGRRSPYTITYTGHERNTMELSAAIRYDAASAQYYLRASFRREKLENRAETFRELTNQNGATYYEYYDPVEMGDKWWRDLQLSWTSLLGMQGETPTWRLNATYQWGKRTERAYLYPFFRRQQIHTNEVGLNVTRNLISRRGIWSLTLEGGFRKGSGSPFDDGVFAIPSSKQEQPAVMEAMLWREYQWLCAAQYRIGGSVQYAFVFPGTRLKTHARLSASHRKANETFDYSQGCDRTQLSLALGCTF
ncbi:MAG: hypothetical protein II886_13915 [Prevotella sp.]|nr:hypothetical protein [Prevotella sp.]